MAIYNESMAGGLNVKDCTADASKILEGYTAGVGKEIVTGEMKNNGGVDTAIVDGVLKEGYTSGGKIEDMISANGYIAEMKVGSTAVTAGSPLTMSYNLSLPTAGTEINTDNYTGCFVKVVEVLPNIVFLIHGSSTSGGNLIGKLYSVKNGSASLLDSKTIVSGSYAGLYPNIVKLKNGKVFIGYFTDSSYNIGGAVCTVESNTIIVKSTKTISTDGKQMYSLVPLSVLDKNKVVMSYCGTTSYLPRAVVCLINDDDSITVGTPVSLSSINSSGGAGQNVCAVNANTFVANDIRNSTGSSGVGYIHVCTVNGTTITISHANATTYACGSGTSYMYPIGNNACAFLHNKTTSNILHAYICVENGRLLYLSSDNTVFGGSTSGDAAIGSNLRGCKAGNIFVAMSADISSSKKYLQYILYGQHGTHNSSYGYFAKKYPTPNYQNSGDHRDVITLSDGSVAIFWGISTAGTSAFTYRLSFMSSNEGTVSTAKGNSEICGIALESGTAGQTIKVFVPEN